MSDSNWSPTIVTSIKKAPSKEMISYRITIENGLGDYVGKRKECEDTKWESIKDNIRDMMENPSSYELELDNDEIVYIPETIIADSIMRLVKIKK